MRTERTKLGVLQSLEAIRRRTQQAIAKVDPTVTAQIADAEANVKLVEAAHIVAEMFVAQPQAMSGFQTDSIARVVADALSTILGRPFCVVLDPSKVPSEVETWMDDDNDPDAQTPERTYSIEEGAR